MSLRTKVLRGGVYLVLRQALATAIAAIGVILLTRAIGPGAYGVFAAAAGVYAYLSILSQWGVEVYLIRREEEPQPQDYHQAFSLLLLISLTVAGLAFVAVPFLQHWVRLERFGSVAIALFLMLPIEQLRLVPLARLERALDYQKVALIELSGLAIFYPVALPLAYRGLGPWAPVGGWWAQQLLTLCLLYWTSAYRPRLYWEPARVRAMLGYGLGYSTSQWIWELRLLVNPLVVSRYAGAEAAGYVALAMRLVAQLGFARTVAWRLSIAALARLQRDRDRLVNAMTEGMSLQVIATGSFLAGFGWVAPWIVPLLFGSQWTSTLAVYPFIAVGSLSNAVFTLHSSVLYVLRDNWKVATFHLVHIALFAGSALLLVPRLGLAGYGWAEVIALPSYILIQVWIGSTVGSPKYSRAAIWYTAFAIPLFSWQLGPWTCISVMIPLVWPATRKELWQIIATVFSAVSRTETRER